VTEKHNSATLPLGNKEGIEGGEHETEGPSLEAKSKKLLGGKSKAGKVVFLPGEIWIKWKIKKHLRGGTSPIACIGEEKARIPGWNLEIVQRAERKIALRAWKSKDAGRAPFIKKQRGNLYERELVERKRISFEKLFKR